MTTAADIDLQLLEPVLREFVKLIGLPATMAMVEAHGGTRLCIAQKADENAALVALIGTEKAAILGRQFGTERPFIPKALPALTAWRDSQIRADLERMSVRQVALKYKLGERRVYQLSGPPPEAPKGLFD